MLCFENLSEQTLGHAAILQEISFGTTRDNIFVVEEYANTHGVASLSGGATVSPPQLLLGRGQ